MDMMGGCMAGMGVLWLALTLALLAGMTAAIIYLVRKGGRTAGEDRALALLRERFARGEIDRAEYEERRNTLLRQFPGDTAGWPA